MLEFVIDDDLNSPLACPSCRAIYVRCSLQVLGGGASCRYCGAKFDPTRASACSSPPAGLSVSDRGADWSIDISTRSPRAALGCLASGVGVLGALSEVDHVSSLFSSHLGNAIVIGALGSAVAVALFVAAAYWCWGRYSISVSDSAGTVFRGIERFGKRQMFSLPGINGVRLTRGVHEEEQVVQHVIRLEGVDFHMDFGADLTEQQRTYIALFLLQRISALSGPSGFSIAQTKK